MFQASIVVFLIGSILSGLSQSMMQLVLFRGLQGLGAGGLMSLPMAIIGDILSPRQRGRYQGYMVGVFSLSSIAGPAIGGFFTREPVLAVVLLRQHPYRNRGPDRHQFGAQPTLSKDPAPHRLSGRRPARWPRWPALLLVTVWGGSRTPWNSPEIITLIVAPRLSARPLHMARRACGRAGAAAPPVPQQRVPGHQRHQFPGRHGDVRRQRCTCRCSCSSSPASRPSCRVS